MDNIAIIGMGCLLPGADTPEKYWQNLCRGGDNTTSLTKAQTWVEPDIYYDPVPGTPDKICNTLNGYIHDFHFEAKGYALPEEELVILDNLFQWTIYAAEQALNDSGYRHRLDTLKKTGLLIGNIGMPTHSCKRMKTSFYHRLLTPYVQQLLGRPDFKFSTFWPDAPLSDLNLLTGSHNATIAAQALALQGPTYALDAACSSSIYAIKMAADYLASGKADMMLAGAVCHADHIFINHGFNVLHAFPANGVSIPFDKRSGGLKAGEGAGIVVLKRYADAIRDNDKIYGVIESIGLSNDAGAKHLLVPETNGQRLALERAYAHSSSDIDYLECHATGTPVGDQTELATIESFFADTGRCPLLGANKANNGHMLTASGMGSLLKVLLSMQHGVIPATSGVEQFVTTPAGKLTLAHVVRQNQPWPDSAGPKRAGINAFGFGGVNAHMVLRGTGQYNSGQNETLVTEPIALVGIGVHLSQTEDVASFDTHLQQGHSQISSLPPSRWKGMEHRPDLLSPYGISQAPMGAYIETFEFDCKRFRLPPNVVGPHLLSHLFLLPIAERAFIDAGYLLDGSCRNIAVIVANSTDHSCLRYQARNEISWQLAQSLENQGIHLSDDEFQDLETLLKESLFPAPYPEGIMGGIGNIIASRIAAYLRVNGPVFSLYSEESSSFKAIELAQFMLSSHQVEAVVIASASFAGGLENVLWDHQSSTTGRAVGDGGGVIVLRREQDVTRESSTAYAVVDSLSIQHASTADLAFSVDEKAIVSSMKQALNEAGCDANQIDYLEVYAGGRSDECDAECSAISEVYSSPRRRSPLTIGSIKANYGHLSVAGGLLSIIKTALQLTNRYLPAQPSSSTVLKPYTEACFLSSPQTTRWLLPDSGIRRAAINYIGIDRAYIHMILREPERVKRILSDESPADGLKVTVYTGENKTFTDALINANAMARFSHVRQKMVKNVKPQSRSSFHLQQVMRNAQTQLHYLRTEQMFYRRLATILDGTASAPVFDEYQLHELTDGCVVNVLGSDYAEVDSYPVRTRMPSAPYLFVSRITALSAHKGKLAPCYVEWEYDIPVDAWYLMNGRVPAFVALESSHAMIVAFTVIGCDSLFKGNLCYRAVDSQTTVYGEMPKAGDVLRGRVDITSFTRVGGIVLITYDYYCYVGEKLVFKLVANSGFFSRRAIAAASALDTSAWFPSEVRPVSHTLKPYSTQRSFNKAQLDALIDGDISTCFSGYPQGRYATAICNSQTRMLHRVVEIDATGGAFGLGQAIGEVDISPDHWVFGAHFKNDPVMPGTFLVEGCEQLVKFFLYYLGISPENGFIAQPMQQHQYSAQFRGEVKCEQDVLRYRLTCQSLHSDALHGDPKVERISLTFIVEIIYRGNVIGLCNNLGAAFIRHFPITDGAALTQELSI